MVLGWNAVGWGAKSHFKMTCGTRGADDGCQSSAMVTSLRSCSAIWMSVLYAALSAVSR